MLHRNPLQRPFPDRDFNRATVLGYARIAIFVFVALYLFRPQGIDRELPLPLVCLGYALVTFLVSFAYGYVTSQLLNWDRSGDGWTLGRWILDSGLLLLLIAIGNFVFYNATVGWTAFHPYVLAAISVPTIIIGLFPIAASGLAVQLRAERENERLAGLLSRFAPAPDTAPAPALVALDDAGEVMVRPADLLFCEARQNYARCVYLVKGQLTDRTVRTTLSNLEARLAETDLIRCHRSYLVNPTHLREATGNAQGLRLSLVGTDEIVPVSRRYVEDFRHHVLG